MTRRSILNLGKPDYADAIDKLGVRQAAIEARFALIESSQALIMARLGVGGIITPTPTPVQLPAFTRLPSITTDGSPTVGEVVGFDFGDGTGAVASRLLRTDTATVTLADASVGSFQLQAAGSYVLEVTRTLNGAKVVQASVAIAVGAAVATSRTAPIVSFPTGRVAGTNPPEIVISSPDGSIDKSTDSFVYSYTNAGTPYGPLTIALVNMRQTADQRFEVPGLGNLVAGSFSFGPAQFTGPTGAPSGNSNIISDTLNAQTAPPATTTFNPQNKSSQVVLSTDYRSMTGSEFRGEYTSAAFSRTRTDKRRWEIKRVAVSASGQASNNFGGGISPAGTTLPDGGVPAGSVAYANLSGSTLDVITFECTPATSGNNGVLKVWENGVLKDTKAHSLAEYLPYGLAFRNDTLRLDAGQETLAYASVSTAPDFG